MKTKSSKLKLKLSKTGTIIHSNTNLSIGKMKSRRSLSKLIRILKEMRKLEIYFQLIKDYGEGGYSGISAFKMEVFEK